MWRVCLFGIYPVTCLLRYMFKPTIQIFTKKTMDIHIQHSYLKAEPSQGCIVQSDGTIADLPDEWIPCVKLAIVFRLFSLYS